MKKGTTTPLPPYCGGGGGLEAEYDDVSDIIADIWGIIMDLEKQIEYNHHQSLKIKLNYYYDLSVYWEYVYLMVKRQKFYDSIF